MTDRGVDGRNKLKFLIDLQKYLNNEADSYNPEYDEEEENV